jgi:hypothetical protein
MIVAVAAVLVIIKVVVLVLPIVLGLVATTLTRYPIPKVVLKGIVPAITPVFIGIDPIVIGEVKFPEASDISALKEQPNGKVPVEVYCTIIFPPAQNDVCVRVLVVIVFWLKIFKEIKESIKSKIAFIVFWFVLKQIE